MKTTEILKRTYYALTVGLLFVLLIGIAPIINGTWPFRYTSFIALLSLGICWIMTRHNKPVTFKWYAGVIVALTFLYIYMPMMLSVFILAWGDATPIFSYTLVIGCATCAVISTFLSNTKYHNVLPNQSKGVSATFRVISWIGQFIVWVMAILMITEMLGVPKLFYSYPI